MSEGELQSIASYPQLLDVMRKMVGQLERDLEVTANKIPVLKGNLVRVKRALEVLEAPVKQHGGMRAHHWTPEKRAAAAKRMREMNALRREKAEAEGGDGRKPARAVA